MPALLTGVDLGTIGLAQCVTDSIMGSKTVRRTADREHGHRIHAHLTGMVRRPRLPVRLHDGAQCGRATRTFCVLRPEYHAWQRCKVLPAGHLREFPGWVSF